MSPLHTQQYQRNTQQKISLLHKITNLTAAHNICHPNTQQKFSPLNTTVTTVTHNSKSHYYTQILHRNTQQKITLLNLIFTTITHNKNLTATYSSYHRNTHHHISLPHTTIRTVTHNKKYNFCTQHLSP